MRSYWRPHSIAIAGWNEALPERTFTKQSNCLVPTTFYGMSFSNRVAEQLKNENPCFSTRQIAGPGAPLSHSYFMAKKHAKNDDSKYAVLGVLASSLPKVTTMAHFNSAFEFPGAHTYPRYSVNDKNQLISTYPPANSLLAMRETLFDKEKTSNFVNILRENDAYFDNFVFSYSWLDYSNIAKMLRRSYAQKNKRDIVNKLFKGGKFTNHLGLRATSLQLVKSFSDEALKNQQTPIVLLINDRGYEGALDELFIDFLEKNDISYISSTAHIDSANLSNFLADGHFTEENDKKLAKAVEQIILENES